MGIINIIGDLFKPAAKLIDDLHTSDEEKLKAKVKLEKIQNEMSLKALEYDKKLMESQAKIISSESQGQSWLQRNWRPITMMTFLVLIICDSFGILENRLHDEAWTLLQLGLGGYVVGRSAEKLAPTIKSIVKKQ